MELTLHLYIIVLQKRHKNKWKEFPKVWFEELNIESMLLLQHAQKK